jgi:hypothetical protein
MRVSGTLAATPRVPIIVFIFLVLLFCSLLTLRIHPSLYPIFKAQVNQEIQTANQPIYIDKPFEGLPFKNYEELHDTVMKHIPRRLKSNFSRFYPAIALLSEKYNMDPLWVISVIWTESHFNPKAKSHVGARGLMQIMPATKIYLKGYFKRRLQFEHKTKQFQAHFRDDLMNKNFMATLENIELGIFYLKSLVKKFSKIDHAIIAYNMGPGWLKYRLKHKLPVGVKNRYLNKVRSFHKKLSKSMAIEMAQNESNITQI